MIRFLAILLDLVAVQGGAPVGNEPGPAVHAGQARSDPVPGRFVTQRIDRGARICVYRIDPEVVVERRRRDSFRPGTAFERREDTDSSRVEVDPADLVRERRFAVDEHCPYRDPQGDSPALAPIPLQARLRNEELRDGRRYCVYSYLGRRYDRPASLTGPCPTRPQS